MRGTKTWTKSQKQHKVTKSKISSQRILICQNDSQQIIKGMRGNFEIKKGVSEANIQDAYYQLWGYQTNKNNLEMLVILTIGLVHRNKTSISKHLEIDIQQNLTLCSVLAHTLSQVGDIIFVAPNVGQNRLLKLQDLSWIVECEPQLVQSQRVRTSFWVVTLCIRRPAWGKIGSSNYQLSPRFLYWSGPYCLVSIRIGTI